LGLDHESSPTWVDRKDYFVLILVFCVLPIASQAGGLGIAAITALGGVLTLIGLGPAKIGEILKHTPKPVWALMALLFYGLISSAWSPYQSNRSLPNPAILLLGVPLYFLFVRAVVQFSKAESIWLRRVWIWSTIGSAIAILVDLTTGYTISLAIDPVSAGENAESRRGDLIQNLGHGVAVLTLLFPAVAVTLWQRGTTSRIISIVLGLVILMCGIFAGMSASICAFFASLVFMIFAAFTPRIALAGMHIVTALALTSAPLFALFATKLSATQLASIPFSWEERLHNWRYIFEKIGEHPVIGHGFDAVRTFQDKHTIRGFDDRAIVSLHPHNAGLHIWVELGLIGIAICVAAIYLSYKGVLSSKMIEKPAAMALCGTGLAAITNASLTFGVWQDWWWAVIITAFSTSALIPYTTENI